MCCFCAGTCNHIGNHAFCAAHSQIPQPVYQFFTTDTSDTQVKVLLLETEVAHLKRQLQAREDEIALLMVIANDLREAAHSMVQDAQR